MQLPWVSRKKYNEVVDKLERLLCQATGNLLSKSTYPIEVMEEQAMDYVQRRCDEAVKESDSEKLQYLADQIKLRFYYHFEEIIPSVMSDEIDEILKEIESEDE